MFSTILFTFVRNKSENFYNKSFKIQGKNIHKYFIIAYILYIIYIIQYIIQQLIYYIF